MFILTTAITNLTRQLRRNTIAVVFIAAAVSFLCSYMGNIQTNREQLASLPQTVPVSAHISNLNGSLNVGLEIKASLLRDIQATGTVRDMVTTVQIAANFAPETQEERIKPKKIRMAGVNALTAYPSIKIESDTGFLDGDSNRCVADRRFMEFYGLAVGNEITLDMYRFAYDNGAVGTLKYEYLAARTLKIVGGFGSSDTLGTELLPDIVVPIGWAEKVFEESGVAFFADSASFFVKDQLRLNEFKAAMKELTLLPVNRQAGNSVKGYALVVNDETFIHSATSIRDNLLLLLSFLPLLIIIVFSAGYVVSHLMLQSRGGEFALMRSLGAGKSACSAIYMGESVLLALFGGSIGISAALLLTDIHASAACAVMAAFSAAYMIGAYIAVRLLGRVSVLSILSKAD